MILYRLRCAKGHEFDSWFKDGKTYERQEKRSLIGCSVVRQRQNHAGTDGAAHRQGQPGDTASALRLPVEAQAETTPKQPATPDPQMAALAQAMPKEMRETLLKLREQVEKKTFAGRREVRRGGAQDPLWRERQAWHLRPDHR